MMLSEVEGGTMILQHLIDTMKIRNPGLKIFIGATITALIVSLGTVCILWILGIKASVGLTAGLGAMAAAAYGVNTYRSS